MNPPKKVRFFLRDERRFQAFLAHFLLEGRGKRFFSVISLLFLLSFFSPIFSSTRVDQFQWQHVQTEHFDIYFDESSSLLTPRMAHYLEKAWSEVGKTYDFYVPERTPFFFYSNHNEFEQTNIVNIGEGTGGVTEAFKNRFLIFNDGSETWMKHVIYHEFTHVVQFNILYGGFWKSARLLKSPFYPLWFMEGCAEFGSGDIDEALGDMVVRDAVFNKNLPLLPELQGFSHLKPNQVTLGYKTGEAAVAFLKDEFGQEKVKELFLVIKDHFDISSALDQTLGLDLFRFDFRFQEWMNDKYALFFETAQTPDQYGLKVTQSDGIPQFNEGPALSPDGEKLYYFSDQGGPTELYELNLKTNQKTKLIGLEWSQLEHIQPGGKSISVSKDGRRLVFVGEKLQRDYLYFYDLLEKKLEKVQVPFDEVRSPAFSPIDNNELVCVGMMRGYNDLYIVNTKAEIKKRLTNSPQDERSPTYSIDGSKVYFSGEVLTEDKENPAGRDIFSINISDLLLSKITDLPGIEMEPETLPNGDIVFVRDRDDNNQLGFDLWLLRQGQTIPIRLTQSVGGMFTPRYDLSHQNLWYVGFFGGERHIFKGHQNLIPSKPVVSSSSETISSDSILSSTEVVNTNMKSNTQAWLHWPKNDSSPLFLGPSNPYKFKGSTDLFLPFFFYSSQDGLVFINLLQASDLLGNHQLSQQLQFSSGNDFYDLAMAYTYARFRPQFTFAVRNSRFYRTLAEDEQRRETNAIVSAGYPLDRYNAINLGLGITNREDLFFDLSEPNNQLKDRFIIGTFSHSTITGRYLVPTRGRKLDIFYQQGSDILSGDQQYKSGGVEAAQYIPFPRESTFASRIFYGRSSGRNSQVFRLGGSDRIRGLSQRSDDNKKTNSIIASSEMRFRLKYLNARTKFLFPDFFFKAAYLVVFNDVGYGWDSREERKEFKLNKAYNSTGLAISWPTFILQSFQLNLTVQYAKRTDNGGDVWYITTGPSF
ncbi:MAG: peptidase MA family metallohydrolase [Elusimicrobiota bacterium]